MSAAAREDQLLEELRARVETLEVENENLRTALGARIVVEQAKGVLIERLDLPPEAVFELLRAAARRSRVKVADVAAEILKTRVTPDYIEREIRHLMRGNGAVSWRRG
jgi:AmiR/NasT family two-component response regulator